MPDVLQSLKNRVTLEHIEGEGPFQDMGLTPTEILHFKNIQRSSDWCTRLEKLKAQIREGDELWYYEWRQDALSGAGGYALIRKGEVVDCLTSWKS